MPTGAKTGSFFSTFTDMTAADLFDWTSIAAYYLTAGIPVPPRSRGNPAVLIDPASAGLLIERTSRKEGFFP